MFEYPLRYPYMCLSFATPLGLVGKRPATRPATVIAAPTTLMGTASLRRGGRGARAVRVRGHAADAQVEDVVRVFAREARERGRGREEAERQVRRNPVELKFPVRAETRVHVP